MKLNNKGMAISGILYTILVLFIVLIFGVLSVLASTKYSFDKFRNDIMKKLNNDEKNNNKNKYIDPILNGADPILSSKMIPVRYDLVNKKVIVADANVKWYDYTNKNWANVVVLNRDNVVYSEGEIINENDIAGYFVWIPRYEYKTNNEDAVSINFINKQTVVPSTDYIIHPSFTFGDTELSGVWVSKFEITNTIDNIETLANKEVLSPNSLAETFNAVYNSQKKWIGTEIRSDFDTHVIKSTEWGMVSLLSYSIYGNCLGATKDKCTYPTENISLISGSGDFMSSTAILTSNNINITGIYDMYGSKQDSVMGFATNDTGEVIIGANISYNTGFNGLTGDNNLITTNIDLPNNKYYDKYPYNSNGADKTKNLIGDAIYDLPETIIKASSQGANGSALNPFVLRPSISRGGFSKSVDGSRIYNANSAYDISNGYGGFSSNYTVHFVISTQ